MTYPIHFCSIHQIRGLLKCFDILQSFKNEEKLCNMALQKWSVLKELFTCLKPMYQATIVMQKEDFRLSDFNASWIFMNNKLEKSLRKHNKTRLAEHLLSMLARRKHELLGNPALISSLALDPRFCSDLDENQTEIAIETLTELWKRLQTTNDDLSTIGENAECSVVELDSSSDDDITISNTTSLKEY